MQKSKPPFGADDIVIIVAFDETSNTDRVGGRKCFRRSRSRKGDLVDEFGFDVDKMEGIILGPIKWPLSEDAAQSQERLRDGQPLDVRVLCHGHAKQQTDVVKAEVERKIDSELVLRQRVCRCCGTSYLVRSVRFKPPRLFVGGMTASATSADLRSPQTARAHLPSFPSPKICLGLGVAQERASHWPESLAALLSESRRVCVLDSRACVWMRHR